MYFSKFPIIEYSYYDSVTDRVVTKFTTNLLISFRLSQIIKENADYFYEYIVQDTDRPDIIAHKLYGNSNLHWLVLLVNDIHNLYESWVKSIDDLNSYINSLYGTKQAFFVDLRSYDSIGLNEFVPGNVINQGNTTQATIDFWDASLQKLAVESVTGSFSVGATAYTQNASGETFGFKLSRIVQDYSESLHHFEDATGKILDPNGFYINNTLVREPGIPTQETNTLIEQYINNGIITQNVVTVRENEESKNEKRRTIKLIKPEYLEAIFKKFDSLPESTLTRI